jgi:uncharacterized protein YndB with AHSA1/START domain
MPSFRVDRRAALGGLFAIAMLAACAGSNSGGGADDLARASGTNRAFSHQVTTTAPAATIWSAWTTPASWGDWDLGLTSASLDGDFVVGAKGEIQPRSGSKATFTVVAVEPGKSCTFETQLPMARLVVTRTIVSEMPTVFRHDVSFTGPLAGIWAGQLGPDFRTALPPTMEKLKALAEGNPS